MSSFENLRIVDNFYQTSLYFPMSTVIIPRCVRMDRQILDLIRLFSRTT